MPDHRAFEQVLPKLRPLLACAAMLLPIMLLAGCGKKPAHVDPPPGVENDIFPRTYPDPATDPKP